MNKTTFFDMFVEIGGFQVKCLTVLSRKLYKVKEFAVALRQNHELFLELGKVMA